MMYLVIGLLVPLAGAVLWWLRKPAAAQPLPARAPARAAAPEAAPAVVRRSAVTGVSPTHGPPMGGQAAATTGPAEPEVPWPDELAQCRLLHPDELPVARRSALVDSLRRIPRPPLSLNKLMSEEMLARASSSQLSDLILGEARIAAKILATVNAPFYGLQRPVASIGQGVTYLGLNSVRSICLQYLLDESFQGCPPEVRRTLDTVMAASACASELSGKLALRLELPEPGALVTQVVLSFLGPLAAASLMPAGSAPWRAETGWLARTRAEELALGLSAVELGGLLMHAWELPPSIVDEVRDIDRMVITPADGVDVQRRVRLALGCLCARLGEDLALGRLRDLAGYDPAEDPRPEFHLLKRHLAAPQLQRLVWFLHSPEIATTVKQMRGAMAARR